MKKMTIIKIFKDAGGLAFRSEKVHQESADAVRLNCPDNPENKEDHRHREGHVEIGVGAAKQGTINVKGAGCRIEMSPADGADAGNQPKPVSEEDENEDGGEEPERFLHQIAADDALEKIVETFHQPFPKVLHTGRDGLIFRVAICAKTITASATIHDTSIEFVTQSFPI